MQDGYYQNSIYPFQDKILEIVDRANVDFYLTGRTALSRLEAKDLADIVYRDLEEDLLRIHDDIFYGRKNSLANG